MPIERQDNTYVAPKQQYRTYSLAEFARMQAEKERARKQKENERIKQKAAEQKAELERSKTIVRLAMPRVRALRAKEKAYKDKAKPYEAHARMDLTTQKLNPLPVPEGIGLPPPPTSTYQQTPFLAALEIHNPETNPIEVGLGVAVATPLVLAGAPLLTDMLIGTVANAPAIIEDIATYTAADIGSETITGRSLGDNVNRYILDLPEGHPVGDLIAFSGVPGARWAGRKLLSAISPEYAFEKTLEDAMKTPILTRTVNNGKIEIALASDTKARPRRIVIEPLGNNKFRIHIKTWDGDHVPANLSRREVNMLYDALYNELPEGAEILFPESGPDYLATRGTVAALKRMARDPRYAPGEKGTLLYTDKDGAVKEFTGTGFVKKKVVDPFHTIQYTPTTITTEAPSFIPLGKNYFKHNSDYVLVVEDKLGPTITLFNPNKQKIGDISLLDNGNGLFNIANINSSIPGGSGALYNAAIKYGQLKYGDLFKGIISGELLTSPEKTLNVTKHFPNLLISNKGIHGESFDKLVMDGPIIQLTGQSSYYPTPNLPLIERLKSQLSTAERFGIPKGERGQLTLDLQEALSDLYLYITSGRYRQNFIVNGQDNFVWGTNNLGTPAYLFLRNHGILGRGDSAWMDVALLTDYGKGYLRYSPILNAAHWTQKGFPEVPGMSWVPGEAKMAPYPNGTNLIVLTPQSNEIGAQLANDLGNPNLPTTIPREVMRNFWGNVTNFQRPGTYLSGDAGNAPLGHFLIKDYVANRRLGIFPLLNLKGDLISITRMGLSPDSYSSIIRQGHRNPAYELRWGEGFRNWNDSAIKNKYIYDRWLKWKNGEISLDEYKRLFDAWAKAIGGRPLEIQTALGKQYPVHPHPFLYRRRQGGKLNKRK